VAADPKSKASSKDRWKIGFGIRLVTVLDIVGFPPNAASSSAVVAGPLALSNAGNRAPESGKLSEAGTLASGEPFFAEDGRGKVT